MAGDDPANAGVRDEFRLDTFPPAGGASNNAAKISVRLVTFIFLIIYMRHSTGQLN